MENSNTLKSFINGGFKIERDGEIITLTKDEMYQFSRLDILADIRSDMERLIESNDEYKSAAKHLDSEKFCYGALLKVEYTPFENVSFEELSEIKDECLKIYLDRYGRE